MYRNRAHIRSSFRDRPNNRWSFTGIAAIITAIVGLITTLTTFFINLAQWASNPQTLHIVSAVGYLMIALGAGWIAFFDRDVSVVGQKVSLVVFAIITGFYFVWVGTWIVPMILAPRVIDGMEGVSQWSPYIDKKTDGSTIILSQDTGRYGSALRGNFNVIEYGYAAFSRNINPQMLAGTRAIGFTYKSTGAPNTIELKLIYQPNKEKKEAVFSVLWNHRTGERGWTSLQVPYTFFTCWAGTGCNVGEALDINKIGRLDIAVSDKPGDQPGNGTIWVDEVFVVP